MNEKRQGWTPEKQIASDRLHALPDHRWIQGNTGSWHLGRKRLICGTHSGLAMHAAYFTACSGKQLGGPWGDLKAPIDEIPGDVCNRCQKAYDQLVKQKTIHEIINELQPHPKNRSEWSQGYRCALDDLITRIEAMAGEAQAAGGPKVETG